MAWRAVTRRRRAAPEMWNGSARTAVRL